MAEGYRTMARQIGLAAFGQVVVDVGPVFVEGVAHFVEDGEAETRAVGNKTVGAGGEGAVHGQEAGHGELEDGIVEREFEIADAVAYHLLCGEAAVCEEGVVAGVVEGETVVGGGDKGLVKTYLCGRKVARGGIDGVAVDVEPLAGGNEGAVHFAVKLLDRSGGEAVVVEAEVVEERVGVGVDIPEEFGQHVLAQFHPGGHVVGTSALLEHEADAVVVEVFEIGLEDVEVGEGIPHVAELDDIVPDVNVVCQFGPFLHIAAERGLGGCGGNGLLPPAFDGAEHDVDIAVGLLDMAAHGLGSAAGELVGQGGDGLVGETASHLVDEVDECAAGATVEGVGVAAAWTLADVVVVVVGYGPDAGVGLLLPPLFRGAGSMFHHGGEVGAEGVQYLGVGEAELPVADTLAAYLGEPFGVAVEVGGGRDEFLESVDIHAVGPAEGPGRLFVVDILAFRTDTDAAVEAVPVGIVGAVVRGVVPDFAIGKGGVVHLVHYGKARHDAGRHIGNPMVGHAEAFELQEPGGTIVYGLALTAIDNGSVAIGAKTEAVVAQFLCAGQGALSHAGVAHKDSHRHGTAAGIAERGERVGCGLLHDGETLKTVGQQMGGTQLDAVGMVGNEYPPL